MKIHTFCRIAIVALSATVAACSGGGGNSVNPVVAVTGVILNKESTTLVINDTETLVATVTPTTASNPNVEWSSDKPDVATVIDGVVTGKSVGTATITVKWVEDNTKKATATVTVVAASKAVSNVSLNKVQTSIIVGKTEILVASFEPSDATNQNVSWKSSDEAVATVANGTVTAKAAGTAKITVTTEDGKKEASTDVTVERYSLVPKSGGGTYTREECVQDNQTGLIWEGKTDDGSTRDKDNGYSNYDSNYGTATQIAASTNTGGYVKAVNDLKLCDFTDWRMPTSDELRGLVVKANSPTIDTTWFPNTADLRYWTSSPTGTYSNDEVFYVSFSDGDLDYEKRSYNLIRVRLVRTSAQ